MHSGYLERAICVGSVCVFAYALLHCKILWSPKESNGVIAMIDLLVGVRERPGEVF